MNYLLHTSLYTTHFLQSTMETSITWKSTTISSLFQCHLFTYCLCGYVKVSNETTWDVSKGVSVSSHEMEVEAGPQRAPSKHLNLTNEGAQNREWGSEPRLDRPCDSSSLTWWWLPRNAICPAHLEDASGYLLSAVWFKTKTGFVLW